MVSYIKRDLHIGVYGIIEKKDEVLVVRKSRGPYKGLFDLPGGKPEFGEMLLDALKREIKEETDLEVNEFSLFDNFSFLIPYHDVDGNKKELYHIALIYLVHDIDFTIFNSSIEAEDVKGSLWLNKYLTDESNSSPLLKKIKQRYEN